MVRPPPGSSEAVVAADDDDDPAEGAVELELEVEVVEVEAEAEAVEAVAVEPGVDAAVPAVAALLVCATEGEPAPAWPPGWVPQPTTSRLSEAVKTTATGRIERPDRRIRGIHRRG